MTKLSHLHFVNMPLHAERVKKMGEESWRVTISGNPALDLIKRTQLLNREDLYYKEKIDTDKKLCLVVFHPQTLGSKNDNLQIKNILEAISETEYFPIFIYQNVDLGFTTLSKIIEKYRLKTNSKFKKSFDKISYYSIMKESNL